LSLTLFAFYFQSAKIIAVVVCGLFQAGVTGNMSKNYFFLILTGIFIVFTACGNGNRKLISADQEYYDDSGFEKNDDVIEYDEDIVSENDFLPDDDRDIDETEQMIPGLVFGTLKINPIKLSKRLKRK